MLSNASPHHSPYHHQQQQSHSPNIKRGMVPIKQGFVYKRGGSGLLAHWKLKYLILSSSSNNPNLVTLQIYDKRDQSEPPKHEIKLQDAAVEVVLPQLGGASGALASRLEILRGGSSSKYTFSISNRSRKFLFNAQTSSDLEDWVETLSEFTSHGAHPRQGGGGVPPPPTRQRQLLADAENYSSSTLPTVTTINQGHHRRKGYGDEEVADDNASNYSDESRYTYQESVARRSRPASVAPNDYSQDNFSIYAATETMSFYSEPILTVQELNSMGMGQMQSAVNINDNSNIATDKRKAPNSSEKVVEKVVKDDWNSKYQETLAGNFVETESMDLRRDVALVEISGSFQETARSRVIKMVDEMHLEKHGLRSGMSVKNMEDAVDTQQLEIMSKKTSMWIRRHERIIYQFCVNYDDASLDDVDEAHVRTSQELHGINAVILSKSGLHVPLTCIVDYKGFRVVCYADMSNGRGSVGGGDNAAATTAAGPSLVHEITSELPRINEEGANKLSIVGRYLNLKPHAVMLQDDRRVTVHTGAGVQIYKDSQMEYSYATKLFEMFPLDFCPLEAPPSPTKSLTSHQPIPQQPVPQQSALSQIFCTFPTPLRRLRPEFLKHYPHALCGDALTEWSAYSRKDCDQNDYEITRASRYLRETWIPAFVRRLDELEIRPIDSRHLSLEMHRAGVNMRYLGLIARISKIPYIRDMCFIEMIARAFKYVFRNRTRNALLHFRAVGATSIDDQLKDYTATMFNTVLGRSEKAEKFWYDKLEKEIYRKFEFDMEFSSFASLHRPALFMALQYHCGVTFDDKRGFNFNSSMPLSRSRFVSFVPRVKHVGSYSFELPSERLGGISSSGGSGINNSNKLGKLPTEELMAYSLARHFKSLGPKSKLCKNDASAQALIEVSAFYNSAGRHEEAKAYAHSACAAARQDSCTLSLALAQVIETQTGLQANAHAGPDVSALATYKQALEIIEWRWGKGHCFAMALHDRMAAMYIKAKKPEQALEFHDLSLEIALKSLGKHHVITAGYLVKAGIIASQLGQTEISLSKFTEAMHIYQSLSSDKSLVAEAHYHMADALAARGDHDGAISHAQRCKTKREQAYGQQDPRTVDAYRLLARLLLQPYTTYKGVVTPQIRKNYSEAINCLEKVFRYLKTTTTRGGGSGGGGGGHSRRSSTRSGIMTPIHSSNNNHHRRSQSFTSQLSLFNPTAAAARQQFVGAHSITFSGYLLPETTSHPTTGPYFSPPYSPTTILSKNVLHTLTKQIVTLKLILVENPKHRECVRMLRLQLAAANSEGSSAGQGKNCGEEYNTNNTENGDAGEIITSSNLSGSSGHHHLRPLATVPEEEARQVILRLAAVSPSIYIDGILARIEDEDETAIEELAIVLQLTESETVGISG